MDDKWQPCFKIYVYSKTYMVCACIFQFTGLQSLVYGGHSWNSVRLKSGALKKLTFAVSIHKYV